MSRRKLFAANVGEFDIQINESKEVKEDSIYDKMKEGRSVNADLELSKCKRRRKHCRKKCWNCRSSSHFKNKCPYLRCFFCHKMGHLKKNCHLKMLEYIYNTIREDSARKEMMMIKNKEKREEKKQQKELKKKIIETRAKELNCKLENKDGKGEVAVLTWKGKTVGEYLGPGLLSPTLNKFRHNLFNIEQLERVIEKAAPTKAFTLYEGCSFWCACGLNDLPKREFERHVKEHHRGINLKNSQINRPSWMDWVF